MFRRLFFLAFVVPLFFPALARAADQAWDDCIKNPDKDRQIAACTQVLARGAAKSDENFATAHIHRGDAYVAKKDVDRAISDYTDAIRLDPKNASARFNRGRAYILKGDYDYESAISDFTEAIRLDPNIRLQGEALTFRGAAYALKGDYEHAITDYAEAMRLNPTHPELDLEFRSTAYALKGDYERAIADCTELIRLYPESAIGFVCRAEMRARTGDFDGALADSETAIRLNPLVGDPHAYRAYAFGKKGQLDRALAEIEEAFKSDRKSYPSLMLYRGELRLLQGDAHTALADFDALLAQGVALANTWLDIVELTKILTYARAGRDAAKLALASQQPKKPQPAAPAVPLAETRVALVIGNARYAAQSPLKNPSNDARAVASALRGAGFRKVEVAENLSRDALVKTLQTFQEEADRADWAVIYFSGHGVEIGGVNYVVPTDARLKTDRNVSDEAVSIDRLMASVGGAHKLKMIILDACRENPFARDMRRTVAFKSAAKGLGPVEPGDATLVVYAARDGQLARDGEGANSPFAAALAKRLSEPHLEVSKLFRLVRDDVMDATGRSQQPFVYGSLPGREDFFFRP